MQLLPPSPPKASPHRGGPLIPFHDDPRYHTPRWETLRRQAIRLYGRHCVVVGCTTDMTQPRNTHVDHRIPEQDGGDFWDINNLQILCRPHHFAKSVNDAATRSQPVSPNA